MTKEQIKNEIRHAEKRKREYIQDGLFNLSKKYWPYIEYFKTKLSLIELKKITKESNDLDHIKSIDFAIILLEQHRDQLYKITKKAFDPKTNNAE